VLTLIQILADGNLLASDLPRQFRSRAAEFQRVINVLGLQPGQYLFLLDEHGITLMEQKR
jgi:hypothetical protein